MASWADRRDAYTMQRRAAADQAAGLEREYALKQALQSGQWDQVRNIMGQMDTGGGYGTTLKIGQHGPEVTIDPSKAAGTILDQSKFAWETGGGFGGGGGVGGVVPPKTQAAISEKRINSLGESAAARQSALGTAAKFLNLFETGKMSSGAGRKTASFIPGVYTEQGRLDEEFNAFAETAARQALKAAGEQRPTDADVKGMKEAMFGIGRDESVNVELLRKYIDTQAQDENEFRKLTGQPELPPLPPRQTAVPRGPISPTQPKAPRQTRNPGDIVNTRNGPMLIQRVNPDGTYEGIPAR